MSTSDVYRQMAFDAVPELRGCPERVIKLVIEMLRAQGALAHIGSVPDKKVILDSVRAVDKMLREAIWQKKP